MNCPRCGRPVAVARERCLYCGAEISPAAVAAAGRAREALVAGGPPAPPADRTLVVVALEGADPNVLASALGVSPYEAAQWARRGGYHVVRSAPPEGAEAERARLESHGLVAIALDEAAVRADAEPVVASGGTFDGGMLDLRTAAGPVRLAAADLLLVVKGPIVREYAASEDRPETPASIRQRLKFVRTATLDPGFRFHLHRREAGPPVEIDPAGFELGAARAAGSSLLEITSWMSAIAAAAPVDDAFRRIPPALAPTAPAAGGLARADEALRRASGRESTILDNLAQFRFYSAWRGAVERLRRR